MPHSTVVWLCAFFTLTAPFRSWAQGTGAGRSFTIAGRVANAATGEPIRRAMVSATDYSAGLRGRGQIGTPRVLETMTDGAGVFRFADVPAGSYVVVASKPHFTAGDRPTVVVGPSRENLELKLDPLGVIHGSVLDGAGAPLRAINVQLFQSSVQEGRRSMRRERSVPTDDRGQYRLWNLEPGRYYLKIAGHSGGSRPFLGTQEPQVEWRESVAPVYYPAAKTIATATPIVLKAGDDAQADFTVPMEPSFRIRGVLRNVDADEPVRFELMSGDDPTSNRSMYNSNTGQFVIHDVVAGTYRVRATQGQNAKRGEAVVRVADQDAVDVEIALEPCVDVAVKVHCEDEKPQQELRCGADLRLYQDGARSHFEQDGVFSDRKIKGVLPGAYIVEFSSYSGYVSACTFNGEPVSSGRKVSIAAGSAPVIEMWLKNDSGTVEAIIEDASATGTVQLVFVPEGGSVQSPRSEVVISGKADISNLPPGEYTVYALRTVGEVEYTNPEVLRSLPVAARVKLRAGAREEVRIGSVAQ